jgi:glycosyltransferase involved in cell wall biosynthesis
MKAIITSPSHNINENVSGISELTKFIIYRNSKIKYKLFIIGKKDNEKRGLLWILKQIILPIRFCYFIVSNNNDLFHLNVPLLPLALFRDYVIIRIAQIKRKPIILHIHGGIYLHQLPRKKLIYNLMRKYLCASNKIIVLSRYEKKQLCNNYTYLSRDKVIALPNAVETSLDDYEKCYDGKLKIIFIGRIVKSKGLPEIEKALNLLIHKRIDFEFIMCGEGDYRDIFLSNINNQLKIRTSYEGVVTGEKKANLFRGSHIFLLPSNFPEGLPISLLEAMCYGAVPICTPIGSIPDVINHGENGFIVPFHDEKSIVKIICMLEKNRKLMEEVGKNARDDVNKYYSIENYIDKLNNIYKEVAQ